MVRLPGVCNHNPETTVLAHVRLSGLGGVGKKPPDLCGAWCCSACHDVVDGRAPHPADISADSVRQWLLEGVLRTLAHLDQHGQFKTTAEGNLRWTPYRR